jgi:ribosomal subunit interface protein
MQIMVRGQNVPVSDALATHCVDRARRAFRQFRSRISGVHFVFVSLGGTRLGVSRACRVTVDLSGGGHVRYEARAEDYYQAALHTIAGTVRHVQRALQRRRSHVPDRVSMPRPAA